MLFLFRSALEVEKRIHSKLFRKFWRSRGTKEPAYITVLLETRADLSRISARGENEKNGLLRTTFCEDCCQAKSWRRQLLKILQFQNLSFYSKEFFFLQIKSKKLDVLSCQSITKNTQFVLLSA